MVNIILRKVTRLLKNIFVINVPMCVCEREEREFEDAVGGLPECRITLADLYLITICIHYDKFFCLLPSFALIYFTSFSPTCFLLLSWQDCLLL